MRLKSILSFSLICLFCFLNTDAKGKPVAKQDSPEGKMVLLPYPQEVKLAKGTFSLENGCVVEVAEGTGLYSSEKGQLVQLQTLIKKTSKGATSEKSPIAHLSVSNKGKWADSDDAYRLSISPDRIQLIGKTDSGLFYGMQTLIQIIESCGDTVPCLDIADWPDFKQRGYYMDVTRGRVPTLETMKMVADRMARLKLNELQLYVEHTFDFQFNPNIGKDCSPLTAEEIRELDKHCRKLRIELVPSLATFGHMGRVLSLPEYKHLAEVERGKTWEEMTWWNRMRGLTIDPVNPEARELITKMCNEFFPPFSAPLANVCGDETFDLGKGKNKARADKEGTGKMYVEFIQFLHSVCKKHNKRMMMWGDVIKNHKELLPDVPKDIIMLNWGYWANFNYDSTKLYTDAGFDTYVCPGCSGWNRIMNGIDNAEINIRRFAEAGKKYGAIGLLNTDWGDDGHVNFLACSWHPIYTGCEVAWNVDGTTPEEFDRAFCYLLFGKRDTKAAKLLRQVGEMGDKLDYWRNFYNSFDDEKLRAKTAKFFTPEQYTAFAKKADEAARFFEQYKQSHAGDPADLDELITACRLTSIAARKFALQATPDDKLTQKQRAEFETLASELLKEKDPYREAWLKRYKKSDLDLLLNTLEDISSDLKKKSNPRLTQGTARECVFAGSVPATQANESETVVKAESMIKGSQPVLVLAFLLTVMVVVLSLARQPQLKKFFHYFPPLIWMYFIPMICTTMGLIPSSNCDLYRLARDVGLPAILVLLLVPSDTRSIAQLGPKAIGITLFGTLGTVCGAVLSFWFFLTVLPEGTFGPDMWKGVASLSGSWIGGSPDFYAVATSLELGSTASGSTLLGKMIAVDTICCYSWLGVLVSLVAFEKNIDRFNKADSSVIDRLKEKLAARHAKRARPITLHDVAMMVGLAVIISQLCLLFGGWFDGVVQNSEKNSSIMKFLNLSEVVGSFGWGVLSIMLISVALSLTRVRNIEDAGASSLGYFGLYFLLTTIGAKADLNLITLNDIWLFVMGAVWLMIHICILMIGMRLLRVPFFLVATGSMANVGGTASAPVVAAAFHPTLASVGLMMGVFCGIIGTPISLLIVGKLAKMIQGM